MIYANERLITKDEGLLEEAHLMDALETGITGGEEFISQVNTAKERNWQYRHLQKIGNKH